MKGERQSIARIIAKGAQGRVELSKASFRGTWRGNGQGEIKKRELRARWGGVKSKGAA